MLCWASRFAYTRINPTTPVLGGGVADRAGVGAADAGQSGGRTDQHDRSAGALLDHGRYRGLDGVVDAGEVDVDDVAPAVVTGLHGSDTGVGDHDVEPAELVEARLHRGRQRCSVADVGLLGHDAGAGVLDELDGGRQIVGGGQRIGHAGDLLAHVDRDDVAPSEASRTACARPWPRAAPVMKRDFPFQLAGIASRAQLAFVRVARRNRLQHLDVRRPGQVLAGRA